MIYGYIRVSSDKQTVENQRFEIDGWIEETISGTKSYTKRELGKLLRRIKKDYVIICTELSRLGRSLFMIVEFLNICMSKECRVWTIKDASLEAAIRHINLKAKKPSLKGPSIKGFPKLISLDASKSIGLHCIDF